MRKPNRYLIKYDLDMSDNVGDGLNLMQLNQFQFCRGRKEVKEFLDMVKWHRTDYFLYYLNLEIVKFKNA
jgi:hypothetical protein